MVSIFISLLLLFLVFLLRVLLRRDWIALALALVLWTFNTLPPYVFFPNLLISALLAGASLFVLFRYGLLAITSFWLFGAILVGFPITTNLSAWYSGMGLAGLALLLGLVLYAFHTSLGGQPLFGGASLED